MSLVFYDLTTVQAAGMFEASGDVRAHGKPKSGLIERQFMLSLVQTADGLPIDHEVHPGNTAEANTLLPMIRALVARYPHKRVVLVADRGLLGLSNLQELAQLQDALEAEGIEVRLEYILTVPAARYGEFAQSLSVMAKAQEPQAAWVGELDWQSRRLIVAHDPEVAQRRTQERRKQILVQLRRIQHQTARAQDGRKISGLTEINAVQKSLLCALKLAVPTPGAIENPHL